MKNILMKQIFALLVLTISINANAGLITTDVSNTHINVGDTVEITINASDFDESDFFFFDFVFNTDLFSFDSASLQSDLLLVDLGAGLFDGLEVVEESFGLGFYFLDIVPVIGDFTIATFELTAKASGHTLFDIEGLSVFDMNSVVDTYDISHTSGNTLTSTAVPEPAMAVLFVVAFFTMARSTRRR